MKKRVRRKFNFGKFILFILIICLIYFGMKYLFSIKIKEPLKGSFIRKLYYLFLGLPAAGVVEGIVRPLNIFSKGLAPPANI